MNNIMRYINTLNELSILKDYLFTVGVNIQGGTKKKIVNIDGYGYFATPDGKVSTNPRSKYAYPTDEFIIEVIRALDPNQYKLMTIINSQLDQYTTGYSMTNLDMIAIMDNMRKCDCVKHYHHHGLMLTVSDLTTMKAMVLCNKIDSILINLELNKQHRMMSHNLNAIVTVTKMINHAVIFVAKHGITMYIYENGDMALCVDEDVNTINMARVLVKTYDVIMELPHLLLENTRVE